ncbi:MAG: TonB-dependent receptor plug domain-containing protein, partial [Prosthecobacter sp.]|nr:TonB-dependent receptor plug domain-containing protein [Prosthecobacter sp.]
MNSRLFSLLAFSLPVALAAQQPTPAPAPQELETIVIEGKADDLIGKTDTASKGRATPIDFLSRPLMRRGEILETIPGMMITQHAGGGKANQYFLRGFNLDHGTDFSISLEGMPLNMRTHAHGQGYTDLNPLIPELVSAIDYAKGTYTAADGDLSSAGSANFLLWDVMPQNLVRVEMGEYDYYRALVAGTLKLEENAEDGVLQGLTYALEYNYYDGPWQQPEEFNRWNGLLRWFKQDADTKLSVTFMGYTGSWTSTDQIPEQLINNGTLGRYDTLDRTAGGESDRYSVNIAFEHRDDDVVTRANAYAIYYMLDLYSNFTYFLDDPVNGDQFQQAEQRWVLGGNLSRTWEKRQIFGIESDLTLGLQTRTDIIDGIGLWKTRQRQRLSQVRQDDILESSLGLYGEAVTRWTPWFRTVLGLRGDLYYFEPQESSVDGQDAEVAGIVSPKFSAIFGPWKKTELYLNFGTGFHSNDARGVTAGRDSADALVRTMGAEIGLRTQAVPTLTATLAAFWLRSDSELIYVGDAGTNEAGPGSDRYGVELAAYWRPTSWFSADTELALTHARLRDVPGGADHIPNSIPIMFSGGFTLGAQGN